jgi:hypothetical protein
LVFSVTVDDQVRTLLMVDKRGDSWQAVSIGASGLGHDWGNTVRQYSASQGYTYKLVRIYQTKANFVLLGGAGGGKLLSMEAGRIAMRDADGIEPMDPADIIARL